jgi:hypothetical protein
MLLFRVVVCGLLSARMTGVLANFKISKQNFTLLEKKGEELYLVESLGLRTRPGIS